jgi:hypothetical protein
MNFTPLLLLLLIALFAWYLSFLAGRLDRLHHRVETSWANLDGLLQRRAAIALEIARSDFVDPASSLLLTFASHQAREASVKDRSQAESGLSGALAILRDTSEAVADLAVQDLFRELGELNAKIQVAVALHVESVNRTQLIRSKWIIRTFRLAGSAPLPVTYEFESDVL